MKRFRLFLAIAAWATLSITNVHARAVGDVFQGRNLDGTPDGVTYQITSIADGNMTVDIYDTSMTGDVVFPGVTRDSTMVGNANAYYKVTSVVSRAFTGKNFTSVRFSENLLSLPNWTFINCNNLTTIYLPASLQSINSLTSNSPSLTTIVLDPGNTHLKVVDNVLYSADGKVVVCYPGGLTAETYSIPEGVTAIPYYGIVNHNLKTIELPASFTSMVNAGIISTSLTTINVNSANPNFSSIDGILCDKAGETVILCPQAKSGEINMPTIKELGIQCFINCKITKGVFTGVETVRQAAFESCTALEEITFGPALTNADSYFAYYTLNLQRISFIGENANFSVDESGVLYTKDYTRLIQYPGGRTGSYTTHANTKVIGYMAFNFARAPQIIITSNVEEIGNYAFVSAAMSSVVFDGTPKLKKINIGAFSRTYNLKSILLPASLERIENGAFSYLASQTDANKTFLEEVFIKAGSKLSYIGNEAFFMCPYLRTFKFMGAPASSAGSLTIGTRAFANTKLTTFEFPKNIVTIGESAFNGCTEMHTVEFKEPSQIQRIGFAAFQNCGLTSITFPESVRRIENEAFNSCQQLETVEIPEFVSFIGAQAFIFCGKLQAINVHPRNASYSSLDGMLATKDKKTLLMFPAGKGSTGGHYTMLSPSFETINDSAFYYNRTLESVTLPKHVRTIGRYTFALCPNLKTVNLLGNSVSSVHETAFLDMAGASRLSQIDLTVRNGEIPIYSNSPVWGAANSFSDGFISGNVEYFPLSDTEAAILDVQADVTTFVVPAQASDTRNGGNKTYDVKLIGDYAFENCMSDIEEVVVPDGVQLEYVGAQAFIKSDGTVKPLRSVFIVGATPAELVTDKFDLAGLGYEALADGQAVHVRKSAEAAFKAAWASVADKITYKIPFPVEYTYSTFSREFDADFSEYSQNNTSSNKPGWPKVVAFTAGEYRTDGTAQNGDPMNYIIMQSINADATGAVGTEGDGTYIPAGTGVLLKAIDGAAATTSFYYQIHEDDLGAYAGENLLNGVTVAARTVQPTEGGRTNFIVSDNQIHKMTRPRSFPAHKSYLQVPTASLTAGAKIAFFFKGLDEEVVTSIDGQQLTTDGLGNAEVYDLQGRRVTSPTKGIYVRNGKKVVIK